MFLLFLFIIGLAIGSFLNVLIDRLPQEEGIMGRSHCDSCKEELTWKDLFPVLSYIKLGGKCRNCKVKLSFYYPDELSDILTQAAKILNLPVDQEEIIQLANRSRGTPRIALRLLKRARDVAQVHGQGKITKALLDQALDLLEVDPLGLDDSDRKFLLTIIDKFKGGPVGIETLAATLSDDIGTIEDVTEPYLMQIGFLKRSPRGRIATEAAYKHLKRPYPSNIP